MNKEKVTIAQLKSTFKRVKTYFSDRLDNSKGLEYSKKGLEILEKYEGKEGYDKIGLTALILLSEAITQFYPNVNAPNVLEDHALNVHTALREHGEELSLNVQEAIDSIKALGLDLEGIHQLALDIIEGADVPEVPKTLEGDDDLLNLEKNGITPQEFDPTGKDTFPTDLENGTYLKLTNDGVIDGVNMKKGDIVSVNIEDDTTTFNLIPVTVIDDEDTEKGSEEVVYTDKTEVKKESDQPIVTLPKENDPPVNPVSSEELLNGLSEGKDEGITEGKGSELDKQSGEPEKGSEADEVKKESTVVTDDISSIEGQIEDKKSDEDTEKGSELEKLNDEDKTDEDKGSEEEKPASAKKGGKRAKKTEDADKLADEVIEDASKEADEIADKESEK